MGGEFTYQPKWDPTGFDHHGHIGLKKRSKKVAMTKGIPFNDTPKTTKDTSGQAAVLLRQTLGRGKGLQEAFRPRALDS